ncbi:MAG: ABC transporter substrate-binding protein [Meiothermus sp.]|uniref:ABC transporter substrate-binding protein n=2 Tax=Meiothermus sp. TaxID=1955249 RepID=UPI0025E77608|nr:ABC transporter substrate-binding protein [Meiothermus sp.]MCS7069587.1 ABC transporter substrate-binding protein [Meiothermus sp.]
MKVWLVCAVLLVPIAWAQDKSVRVGLQAGGTLSWIMLAIERYGLGRELGLEVKATTFASKDANRLALRSGEVQIVVDDFVEVQLLRDRGFPVRAIHPYSLLTGGVAVPVKSPIQSLADLKGRSIGTTSLTDKTFLMLRALCIRKHGFDPLQQSKVSAVGSPLMAELMERGQLEAALPLWHHLARMQATGQYRELLSSATILRELGLPTDVPLLFIIAREDADPEALRRFLRAVQLASERMKQDSAIWEAILEARLYALPDKSQLPALRKRWESGLPQRWDASSLISLRLLVERLLAVAGPEIVGIERFDPRAFSTQFAVALR